MGETDRPEQADVLKGVRAHVVVTGRVQGVFFRHSCAREAAAAGLAGWVRNRSDGAVEAVFQGDRAGVDALIAWARSGPSGARVEEVSIDWEDPIPGEQPFQVKA